MKRITMLTFLLQSSRRSLVALTLLCVLGLSAPTAQASPILIDDFSTSAPAPMGFGGAGQSLGAGSFNFVDGPGVPGVIGGANATRDTTLNFTAGGIGDFVNLTIGGGTASYTSSSGTADGSFSLLYDANATLLGDLTDSASNNHLIVGVGSNSGATTVTATLEDDASNFFSMPLLLAGPGPTDLKFPLAGFTGVDLTMIQSILISVDPAAGGSVSLTGVVVTPEPSAAMLYGVMCLATLGYRLRRRTRRAERLLYLTRS